MAEFDTSVAEFSKTLTESDFYAEFQALADVFSASPKNDTWILNDQWHTLDSTDKKHKGKVSYKGEWQHAEDDGTRHPFITVNSHAGGGQSKSYNGLTKVNNLYWEQEKSSKGLSQVEIKERREKAEASRAEAQAQAEKAAKNAEKAKALALALWNAGEDASGHPYLVKKQIDGQGFTVKQLPAAAVKEVIRYRPSVKNEETGEQIHLAGKLLLVPVVNPEGIQSLEFIDESGKKAALKNGKKSGNYWATKSLKGEAKIILAEGMATAASITLATGLPAVAVFSCSGFATAIKTLKASYPAAALVIAADIGNGQSVAEKAAKQAAIACVVPEFTGEQVQKFQDLHGKNPTDFNDLYQLGGGFPDFAALVPVDSFQVENQAPVVPVAVPPEASNAEIDESDAYFASAGESEAYDFDEPDLNARPSFYCFDDWTKCKKAGSGEVVNRAPGVWLYTYKSVKDGVVLQEKNICAPLHVTNFVHDINGLNNGLMLKFKTKRGKWRTWSMPSAMMKGAGEELRGNLLNMGLVINPSCHRDLNQYLYNQSNLLKEKDFKTCSDQVGWLDNAFILPSKTIGADSENYIYQSESLSDLTGYREKGTLAKWKKGIAEKAKGNNLLTAALSAAFAGSLIKKTHSESGGFHFYGASSTGKSTLMDCACSVWGGREFKQTWRATANGLEGAASLYNDGLLALDEISQADPSQIGDIIYSLGNGQGKRRADRSGKARGVANWQVFILSNGEKTLQTAMAEGKKKTKAGQEIRLVSVPVAETFGAFGTIPAIYQNNAAAFSEDLKEECDKNHGVAGIAWLEALTKELANNGTARILSRLREIKKLAGFQCAKHGQASRVAARFALAALAGELATEWNLTGWQAGDAIDAAIFCFHLWLNENPENGSNSDYTNEEQKIIGQVGDFIDLHTNSRFQSVEELNGHSFSDDKKKTVYNQAGYYEDTDGGRVYYFNSAGFREAIDGFDLPRAAEALEKIGALEAGAKGKMKQKKIGGRNGKFYCIHAKALQVEPAESAGNLSGNLGNLSGNLSGNLKKSSKNNTVTSVTSVTSVFDKEERNKHGEQEKTPAENFINGAGENLTSENDDDEFGIANLEDI